jgi:hypothetical protein
MQYNSIAKQYERVVGVSSRTGCGAAVPLRAQTHTSAINARRLLQQIADIYSHAIEKTVVVAAVANALDAGAANIWHHIVEELNGNLSWRWNAR